MTLRAQQREDTRNRIVEVAAATFAERGFRAASTRDIADRAGVTQGLVTYHFGSKVALWKAAADRIFAQLRGAFAVPDVPAPEGGGAVAREAIRQYVRFVATHPELFRFMVEEGKRADARTRWLVDTHVKPFYAEFGRLVAAFTPGVDPALLPHAWYAMAGAASLMFAVAPECRRLTGLDPAAPAVIEAHADFIANLLVPAR